VSLDLEAEPGSRLSQQSSLPCEEKHLEQDSCAVRVIEFAPSAQPRTKLSGQEVLEQALGPESKVRKIIIKRGEAIMTGEIFCFYAAILKWEQLVKDSQTTQRNRLVLRLGLLFVVFWSTLTNKKNLTAKKLKPTPNASLHYSSPQTPPMKMGVLVARQRFDFL
jgi:hypothetical protein